MLHLRALNPHVATALNGAGLASVVAPRQPKPLPFAGSSTGPGSGSRGSRGGSCSSGGSHDGGSSGDGGMLCIGVSAFAFQGTNAHAVIGSAFGTLGAPAATTAAAAAATAGTAASTSAAGLHWQRQRLWVHTSMSPLVARALVPSKATHQVGAGGA